jgi:hypothetical protein
MESRRQADSGIGIARLKKDMLSQRASRHTCVKHESNPSKTWRNSIHVQFSSNPKSKCASHQAVDVQNEVRTCANYIQRYTLPEIERRDALNGDVQSNIQGTSSSHQSHSPNRLYATATPHCKPPCGFL